MAYLEKYDEVVSVKRGLLTPAQKIRTGLKTKRDIRMAVALLKNPLNEGALGKTKISGKRLKAEEYILKEPATFDQKKEKGSKLRVFKLSSGVEQVIRPMAENNFGDAESDWDTGSDFSVPASAILENRLIGERQNELIDFYERGFISLDDLTLHLNNLKDSIREVVEVADDGLEREAIINRTDSWPSVPDFDYLRDTTDRYTEEVESEGVAPSQGTMDYPDEQPEGSAEEYQPRYRRNMGGAREDYYSDPSNRGSGSGGEPNPNAPSWSTSNYERGEMAYGERPYELPIP